MRLTCQAHVPSQMTSCDQSLSRFGELIGIPELAFDDKGRCPLGVDDELPIVFKKNDETEEITLFGTIAEKLTEQVSDSLVSQLLRQSMRAVAGAPGIGMDGRTGAVVLYRTLKADQHFDADSLKIFFGEFIKLQKDWIRKIQDSGTEGEGGENLEIEASGMRV